MEQVPSEAAILKAIQLTEEITKFAQLVRASKAQVALEIGAAQCGTSVILGEAMGPFSRVVSVDLPVEKEGTSEAHEREARGHLGSRFTLIRGDATSYEVMAGVGRALDGHPVDLLFIDAGHTEAEAMGQYGAYKRLLSENSMVAFHDICMDALWPMWNKLRGQRPPDRSTEIIKDIRQRDCGIGVLIGK